MTDQVGTTVLHLLEQAGERWLSPDVYRLFLFHIGGGRTLRRYTPSESYWEQVQRILDGFFSSSERAEICESLIERADLRTRPEFQSFVVRALAERRLQDLLAQARLKRPAAAR